MRRFVIVGQKARGGFSLDDLPATSGRLDLLLRSARAALLVSHGVRRDTIVYLVLGGDPAGPRTLRIDGPTAKFLRPDERAFAVMVQKALAHASPPAGFGDPTRGVSVAAGGLEVALADAGPGALYVLDEVAPRDLREGTIDADPIFVLGDHLGLDRTHLAGTALRIGPVSVHADDAVAVVVNELDRQGR